MSWVAVGVGGATALMSYAQAKDRQKQERANMLANAEQIRYSPWTKLKAEIQGAQAQNPVMAGLGGALQGGIGGYSMKQGMNKVDQENALAELQKQKLQQELGGISPIAMAELQRNGLGGA